LVDRFDEIEKKIIPFLRSCGYNVKKGLLLCIYLMQFGFLSVDIEPEPVYEQPSVGSVLIWI
jgi:hypothetical protein